jgi:hypothetical protein
MTEDQFTDALVERIRAYVAPHIVGRKMSLLYDLSFDQNGAVAMGVDPDSGEVTRGRGKGFEQDILVYDDGVGGHTSVIPRIVGEVKFGGVTTHDVIVYSEKADRIRRLYPYVRYGFILGGLPHIPGRVLRLGQRFDFMLALSADISEADVQRVGSVFQEEAQASLLLTKHLFTKTAPVVFQKRLQIEERG